MPYALNQERTTKDLSFKFLLHFFASCWDYVILFFQHSECSRHLSKQNGGLRKTSRFVAFARMETGLTRFLVVHAYNWFKIVIDYLSRKRDGDNALGILLHFSGFSCVGVTGDWVIQSWRIYHHAMVLRRAPS